MRAAWIALIIVAASPAGAMDDNLSLNLGSVLAAEDFCGMSYDQSAIEAFIEKNVPANNMGFASELEMMTGGEKVDQERMSGSEKTAHCAQMRRVAKAYGFTK